MVTETRRPLAWEILSDMKSKVRKGTADEAERLSRESQARETKRGERAWWLAH